MPDDVNTSFFGKIHKAIFLFKLKRKIGYREIKKLESTGKGCGFCIAFKRGVNYCDRYKLPVSAGCVCGHFVDSGVWTAGRLKMDKDEIEKAGEELLGIVESFTKGVSGRKTE